MTYKVIYNALVNKVQTQAICNCRITARARAGLKGREARGNFYRWAPMT